MKYVLNELPYIVKMCKTDWKKAEELAVWLMDQKLCSIRKLDLNKIEKDLKENNDKLKELRCDLSDISKVVLRELDKLKVFYKPRKLKTV